MPEINVSEESHCKSCWKKIFIFLIPIILGFLLFGFVYNQYNYSKNFNRYENITSYFDIEHCEQYDRVKQCQKKEDCQQILGSKSSGYFHEFPCNECIYEYVLVKCHGEKLTNFKYDYFSTTVKYSFSQWWTCLMAFIWLFIFSVICYFIKEKSKKSTALLYISILCYLIWFIVWVIWVFEKASPNFQHSATFFMIFVCCIIVKIIFCCVGTHLYEKEQSF
jgi:amino acid transporter